MWIIVLFFFFQAEDGIRDGHVTGVQTCALPILLNGFNTVPVKKSNIGTRIKNSIVSVNNVKMIPAVVKIDILAMSKRMMGIIFSTNIAMLNQRFLLLSINNLTFTESI